MDLQWQRQTELWLRLMGAAPQPPAISLTLGRDRDRIFLEQDQGRARLTLARSLPVPQRQPTLLRLLQLLQPEAGGGIPLRAWLAGDALWISAAAPPDSGAEQWRELARRQRRLLDRVMENPHENGQ
ncbi:MULTISPECIES: type III secretion protein [Edwardsiella]|uniref:Type III secretion apparatus protein n=2 Tax=Edwardsiella anguillarum TaxID=1821960 RepID=A0A076LL63_9GAMM|nr:MULTISPECIES: type III secretion protein [Edwardsiella]AIJ09195.1 type III secretion apparatus protein [Edwardsiella anguillarum ET080813]AKR77119.1 type III secretion protein [Edwardsiella sp. LADL05-105]KAB0589957.1 type III secretion protein [Edwardsiella anguillarum]UOU80206.1 type III secretion protein [Edwardsiella anguillarum]WHP81125.1 type III secretion protein [Edwardsiella anguillarum]